MKRRRTAKQWAGLALVWLIAVALFRHFQTTELPKNVRVLLLAFLGVIVFWPLGVTAWRLAGTISFRLPSETKPGRGGRRD